MARTAVMRKFNSLLLRKALGIRFRSAYNMKQESGRRTGYQKDNEGVLAGKADDMQFWEPHPKTGIYFPRGHERVMEDIPQGAACLNQTYWVRTTDGVEQPEPDGHSF
ncbi:hypothetical protein MLD38_022898 [Melastoma candidum]|uniref:Uncharacterized protein n=1 Tax=Melastoma candidum TaxID=119954 RepID=A0ACB9QLZ1_9MYRT|nr:hypothetical protein MLD38_022898 [Melastoma candidum]